MTGRAIICGGSIGGLFAALALLRAGWEVEVLERTGVELSGRGAGIVTHPELIAALREVGADTAELGVAVEERVAYDIDGGRVRAVPHPQVVTSWDRIHRGLRALLPDAAQLLGAEVTGYEQDAGAARVRLADGRVREGDLVVGADGFRSAIRGQMLPRVQPEYAGYVVWRALAREADLPAAVRDDIFTTFGLFLPRGTQIIGYPIAGEGNDLRPGHRRYNFVWYAPVAADRLADMLTDADGHRHAISIPPPRVREEVLATMREEARAMLPDPFVEILDRSERPFFTPIYDHCSPRMADGRVALSGDAACVARPHVGMGVTKAALDALALARHVTGTRDVPAALAAYSAERVPAARTAWSRARLLGSYIFDGPDGANPDGRANPRAEEIIRTTAVVTA